jgi:transcription elongation factor Elf1
MERLHFTCPRTGRDVDVGIDSDLETLLRIRTNHILARCPVCGERHEWEVGEAKLLPRAA